MRHGRRPIYTIRARASDHAKCEVLDMSGAVIPGCIAEANLRRFQPTWVGTCHLPGLYRRNPLRHYEGRIADPNRSAQLQRAAGSLRHIVGTRRDSI